MPEIEQLSLREIQARMDGLKDLITSLRAYIDSQSRAGEQALIAFQAQVGERFVASEKSVLSSLQSLERAVIVAETNAEKWRMNANEWRGAMDDREERFVKSGEYHLALGQIREIKETLTRIEARRAGRGDLWGYLVGGFGVLIAIIAYISNVISR